MLSFVKSGHLIPLRMTYDFIHRDWERANGNNGARQGTRYQTLCLIGNIRLWSYETGHGKWLWDAFFGNMDTWLAAREKSSFVLHLLLARQIFFLFYLVHSAYGANPWDVQVKWSGTEGKESERGCGEGFPRCNAMRCDAMLLFVPALI